MKHSRGIIGILFILLIWQALVSFYHIPSYILPTPLLVVKTIYHNWELLLQQTYITALECIAGLILAVALGMFSATIFVYFPITRVWLLPSLIITQALPMFALAPLLVVWLGYGLASKIITVMIMLFFPITTAFYDGLNNLPPSWLDLAKTMQATRLSALRYIALPAALPSLASGLRLAAVAAPLGAIIGEWVGASQGLGYLMLNANARLQINMMFAALFFLIVLALSLFFIIDRGMRWILLKRLL